MPEGGESKGMDDLAEKIQSILSDEESLKQIGELAAMLGLGDPQSAPPPPSANQSSPGAVFQPQSKPRENPGDLPGNINIGALMSLANAFKSYAAEDDNIRLIMALKPLLSEEKRAKADKVIKILKLINLLPLIKDSGILGGDFLGIL